MIEQPFKVGIDLSSFQNPYPEIRLCADESCHTIADLDQCKGYDIINIKLDKTGGLTHALSLFKEAKRRGFKVMVGCMVGSALAIRQAFYLAQQADFVDIDAPLLLAESNNYVSFIAKTNGTIDFA